MEFLEKKIYVSPAPRKYLLWLVGNQLPHLQTTDHQKNRENPTTQQSNIYMKLSASKRQY